MGETLFTPILEFVASNVWPIAVFAALLFLFRSFLSERALPKAHTIAVIGEEQSGKTTLITTLFDELFSQKIAGINASPRGYSTIEKINSDLRKIQQGESIGPTLDQEIFAYRTNLTVGKSFAQRTYKVEIADFSGQRSAELAGEQPEWFHRTEFFKWVIEADAFVFVIDLARYLIADNNGANYVAHISSLIRAAWQNIVDFYDDSPTIYAKPLVLVFTKFDVFSLASGPTSNASTRENIRAYALSGIVPLRMIELNSDTVQQRTEETSKAFSDLIVYMKGLSQNFSVQFVSGFGKIDGKRLNYSKFMTLLLPRAYKSNVLGRTLIRSLRSILGVAQSQTYEKKNR